jgi:catechol 2,3-dioxygenase-like lactoylglutathione lyase family enzyme
MAIIPTLRCRSMRASLAFYTQVLDFQRVDGDDQLEDPAFAVLERGGDPLILSSHAGDGAFGQAIVVTTSDVDADFLRFQTRGLRPPSASAGSPVHAAPLDQSWGTREVYITDPDGHTLRFVRGWDAPVVS